jgi:hypothetical protein
VTLANYSELKADIADWLNRDDLVAAIPSFIRLAETEMAGKLDHWRMETRTALNLSGRYVDLPADFEKVTRIELTGSAFGRVDLMPADQMSGLRASCNNVGGRPQYYNLTAGQLELLPTPDGAYTAEMIYRGALPALSDAAPVNWLLTERPAAYLYGALMQSAPYLKDDLRVAVWAGLYQEALTGLTAADEDAKYGGSLRIRQI